MSDEDDRDDRVDLPEPPSDEEIESRLSGHKQRLENARRRSEENRSKGSLDRDTGRGLGVGMGAAYAIIGLPLAGAGLGWLLDQAVGTTFLVFVGVVVGLVGGMVHAVQLSNRP